MQALFVLDGSQYLYSMLQPLFLHTLHIFLAVFMAYTLYCKSGYVIYLKPGITN